MHPAPAPLCLFSDASALPGADAVPAHVGRQGRASRLLPARFGLIFAFEGLPQPLQFEDQCRALRPGAVAIRFTRSGVSADPSSAYTGSMIFMTKHSRRATAAALLFACGGEVALSCRLPP